MKSNAALKLEAKQVLSGRWKESILLYLVPTFIGILIFLVIGIPSLFWGFETYRNGGQIAFEQSMQSQNGSSTGSFIGGLLATLFTTAATWTLLDVLRRKKETIVPLKDAFRTFKQPYLISVIITYILSSIFTVLWSMLFIIPGIIKAYAYSQAYNIFYDTYQETGQAPKSIDTITASRRIMDGYKGKLFLLDLSFIGWHILAWMTAGLLYIWLVPYIQTTRAVFYNNLPKVYS